MQGEIKLNNQKVEYTYKVSARAKKVRLAIYGDGNFVITVPKNVDENIVKQFILKKAKWIINKIEYFKNNSKKVFISSNKKDYIKYKNEALVLAKDRIHYFNSIYGFKFNNISIKNQKTRWGSCSRKGNLNFNYKIVLIPKEYADYVIVHELCHLKEFNHSNSFWSLVIKTIPNYLEIRRKLKKEY